MCDLITAHATSRSSWRIDVALPLAFTWKVTIGFPLSLIPRVAAHFRLFCVLAVAMVTTFHMCGVRTAQAFQPTQALQSIVVLAASDQSLPDQATDLAGERCHFCTVVSLPPLSAATAGVDGNAPDVARAVPNLASFHARLTSPPPRV